MADTDAENRAARRLDTAINDHLSAVGARTMEKLLQERAADMRRWRLEEGYANGPDHPVGWDDA